jgi:hypothetical protein
MFKEVKSGLSKLFGKSWIPVIIILVICFALLAYTNNKTRVVDKMTTAPSMTTTVNESSAPSVDKPADSNANNYAGNIGASSNVLSPGDLLPNDPNSEWATLNPINQGDIAIPDLLNSGYHLGLDTIGQTLKNPNYQIRSDPFIEKKEIGPWNNSTFEPDIARVPLELGCGIK